MSTIIGIIIGVVLTLLAYKLYCVCFDHGYEAGFYDSAEGEDYEQ